MKIVLIFAIIRQVLGEVYYGALCNGKMNQCPSITGVDNTYCIERNDQQYASRNCPYNNLKIQFTNNAKDRVAL